VTESELQVEFQQLVDYVKAHRWPATFNLENHPVSALHRALDSLGVNGVIECYDRGAEPVYSIAHGKDLSASYYRNNSIHFFVLGAVAELALTKALAQQVPTYREDTFWREVGHLRNMFKFEFYFPPQARLEEEIRADLDLRCPGWQELLASPNPYPGREIKVVTPLLCHGVLEPFLDAYHLVAEKLLGLAAGSSFDQGTFLDLCLFEAEQLYRLRRIAHQETVAKPMFESGLLVAKNRGLLDDAVDDARLFSRRSEFLQEVNDLLGRLQDIRHIAASRRSGGTPPGPGRRTLT
jgi:glycerol-3-phosphate O-acyltransferase